MFQGKNCSMLLSLIEVFEVMGAFEVVGVFELLEVEILKTAHLSAHLAAWHCLFCFLFS